MKKYREDWEEKFRDFQKKLKKIELKENLKKNLKFQKKI